MEHENLFGQLDRVIKEIQRIDRENPTGPDEESDPRIVELIAEGRRITSELDPLMRDLHRNNPVKLAEWEEITHMCDDLDEEEEREQQAQESLKKATDERQS